MYYFTAIIVFAAVLYLFSANQKQEDSPFEIPEININNDEIEKSAFGIENFNYGFNKIYLNRKAVIINLKKSYSEIVKAHEYLTKAVENKKNTGNCTQWLLDNFYLIEREYKEIKNSGLESFYKNLPIIKSGMYKGVPRIFFIAREIVKSCEGRIDENTIETYINACQKNSVLTIAELWALPIMIRAALIESLGKIVKGLVFEEKEINKGEYIADKLINAIYENDFEAVLEDIKKDCIDYNSHFVSSLMKALRENSADTSSIYLWIEGEVEKKNTSIDSIINQEHQKQALCEILMGNCINGIRYTANLNWKESFEKLNLVEKILRGDPYKHYALMDYESRDYYRHSVEKLSRKTKLSEVYIAKKSIECASEAMENNSLDYEKHVGYYLVDDGVGTLKKKLGCKNTWLGLKKTRVELYLAGIFGGTIALTLGLCILNYSNYPEYGMFDFILAFFAAIVPCSEIIISTLNWSLNYIFVPRFIPKLEYSEGIPKENSTIVVIPFLLESEERIKNLVSDMEVYYIANREKNLYFAMLGDFTDSKYEKTESDELLLNTAVEEVNKLNKKYSKEAQEIFYFFNRIRKYNEKQGVFMGWERKRGKLIEFNRLLRGDKNTSYIVNNRIDRLKEVKYVITLDSDTKLPMNSVKKLIGAMSHVLNKPVMDPKGEKILRGHGLMQPRISISTLSANKTIFSRMFSGEAGIDIYSTSVSDVYEDLFDEGIYTGKGIYDIDIFMKVLEGKIPENLVLSHDLLEGSFARAALITDVEFIDDYPAYYTSASKRLHRWVRGDWQISSWIIKRTSLNLLSRWKIFDNLRRSLLAPSIFFMILLSLTILPGEEEWFITAFASIIFPILFDVSEGLMYSSKNSNLIDRMKRTALVFEKVLLVFAFLPFKAYLMMDAITRTIYRLKFSKRNLLEWQTAENTEAKCGKGIVDYIKAMSIGVFAAFILLFAAFTKSIYTGALFIPYCTLWILSPLIAWYTGINQSRVHVLTNGEEEMLRIISRKTWAYFEDFLSEENNWLAPDNYQEYPDNGIAHRTSPTNLGMGLISNITAFDMGYIGTFELIERLEKILNNMESLSTYKGHFYNWYDTRTKEPLNPKYISTVDSGNLAGYLWVISESLDEYSKEVALNSNMISGLLDILKIAQEEVEKELRIKDFYLNEIERYKHCSFSKDILPGIKEVIVKCENANSENSNLYWNKKLKEFLVKFANELNNLEEIHILEDLKEKMLKIKKRLLDMMHNTDFTILYDNQRQLFTIGYDVDAGEISSCYYDLMASESRQASFIAIAKGDVEQGHWFKLGRNMGLYGKSKGLVSWSGTMFEYCMPLLIMKNFPDTLMYETCKAVIREQMEYPKGRSGFWGISESAFYKFDINMNYQYKAFGVPATALKRIGSEELVISPYSSLLGMMVNLKESLTNIKNMLNSGLLGRYGFYEAVDYTAHRIPKGYQKKIIKNYMVHHQGMSLLSIHNILKADILKKRFHNIAEVKAAELLLQEKVPKTVVYNKSSRYGDPGEEIKNYKIIPRKYMDYLGDLKCHLLSNGEYSIMVTNRGGGYSCLGDTMIYRWRADSVCDSYGMFFYIKNLNSGDYWSSAFEPSKAIPDKYEVNFTNDKAQFERLDGNITTKTEITVSQEDNTEIRKITLINHGDSSRDIEITSYLEAVITKIDADSVHPGFSNLFISTEYIQNPECIIAARRPRSKNDKKSWVMHSLNIDGEVLGKVSYETSRAEFIGRCRNLESPMVMDDEAPLKNTIGAVLDPVLSLRTRVRLGKGKNCVICFCLGISDSRDKLLDMAKKYSDFRNINRVFDLSWTQSILELKYMGIRSPKANLFQDLASRIIYINSSIRERGNLIKNIKQGQRALWCYGISGDIPIVSIVIQCSMDIDNVKQGILAHEYLSRRGLKFDLVIINMEESDYIQSLQNSLRDLADSGYARDRQNKPGGIFILNRALAPEEDIDLIKAVSRIVINSSEGSFNWNVKNIKENKNDVEYIPMEHVEYKYSNEPIEKPNLNYFNGFGGFNSENNSYVIILKDYVNTPAPWINVISNENFGFQVSENGVGYTWNINSRENKLTRWSNDPVRDSESEALFLRDEDSGVPFGITPMPFRDSGEYIIEHGLGFSSFKHSVYGIKGEVTMFVPKDQHLKIIKIKLKNTSDKERKISLTYYCRIVLGVTVDKTSPFIYSAYEDNEDYIYSVNPYNEHFSKEKCYLKVIGGIENSYTGDRNEFIGSNFSIDNPEALKREKLSNNTGAGYDPCLAVNSKITLGLNDEKDIIILLGEEKEKDKIKEVISMYNSIEKVNEAFSVVRLFWKELTGTFKVETPDKSIDIMLNGWLVYQTLVCRIWARSAFYQSGGAYGFRDQLQDVMSISWLDPTITREHIIYSASRQFIEGDVQHWWHPVIESGIRTRFSDDLLWLPYVTSDYIKSTGDYSILREEASFLEDIPLALDEDERYSVSKKSEEKGSIYEHCLRALDKALKYGPHNIPLMGSGDWNDGFSTIGNGGSGESIWLGWFIFKILEEFIPLCQYMEDENSVKKYLSEKNYIIFNLEENAWDGDWYRRAYFDDGTPLGSFKNDECQIDSLAQSWGVISGGAMKSRAKTAMRSLEKYLVREDKRMVVLFSPPFDKSKMEPGYIKGYLPGVRENGGQYTHAAVWVVIAMAMMGNNNSLEIFNMLNPINHTMSYLDCEIYKTEPYVMAADVYAVPPHIGRGGWTWYTGASGWMYRAGLEWILGLKLNGKEGFRVEPCIPDYWDKFNIDYKKGKCLYHIKVRRGGNKGLYIENNKIKSGIVPYFDKGEFQVEVII
ncbi:MAG: GH36-type glycosyl hydrolase domain-containing protein [Solirubrobacterales bacterium]